jgi:hypothetical protein
MEFWNLKDSRVIQLNLNIFQICKDKRYQIVLLWFMYTY